MLSGHVARLLWEIAEEWDAHPDQGEALPYLKRKRRTRRGRRARAAPTTPSPAAGQPSRPPTLYFK